MLVTDLVAFQLANQQTAQEMLVTLWYQSVANQQTDLRYECNSIVSVCWLASETNDLTGNSLSYQICWLASEANQQTGVTGLASNQDMLVTLRVPV